MRKRKFRHIGLSALAVLAVSAVSASGANAAEGTATVSKGTIPYVATQVGAPGHTFTLPGGRTLTCEVAIFTGTIVDGAKDVTTTPDYEKCHTFFGGVTFPVTINTTECTYTFTDLTTTGAADTYSALTDVCHTGGPVHLIYYTSHANHTAGTRLCEYTVNKQGPVSGVTFVDNTNGTINVKATAVKVALTRTFGTAGNCGEASTTSEYNGDTKAVANEGTLGIHHT